MLSRKNVKFLMVATVLVLTGCTEVSEEYLAKFPPPPPPKEVRAEKMDFSHDVAFKPLNARFEPEEREMLDRFLVHVEAGKSDHFVLLATNGSDSGISDQRSEMVEAYLRVRGVRYLKRAPHMITGAEGAPPRDSVRVHVARYVVVLPRCPDWTRFPGNNFPNFEHTNFGCASAVNLGHMVADPADLASGRTLGPADADYSAAMIERYRLGKTMPIVGQLKIGDERPNAPSQSGIGGGE
jgi:pilus biogenesis lipoprotein CpaD